MFLISHYSQRGGPRAGSGAAVRQGLCAGCGRAWACAMRRGNCATRPAALPGAPTIVGRHKGHSSPWRCSGAPSSLPSTNLTSPALEHTRRSVCGLQKGEAVATPTTALNHTSSKQVSQRVRRRVCMAGDCKSALQCAASSTCRPLARSVRLCTAWVSKPVRGASKVNAWRARVIPV